MRLHLDEAGQGRQTTIVMVGKPSMICEFAKGLKMVTHLLSTQVAAKIRKAEAACVTEQVKPR